MTNIKIIFEYNQRTIDLQANENDILETMINKCLTKINKTKNDVYFLKGGSIITDDNIKYNVKKHIDTDDSNQINFIVCDYEADEEKEEKKILKKSKQIICPECKENCFFNFKDYKLFLNKCDKKHIKENILLKNFNDLQVIDESQIKCNNCDNNKEEATNNLMYFCCNCKINLCLLCKLAHAKNNKDHKLIDYDFKNYKCNKHGARFISYCINCEKNLCDICEIEDKNQNHKFIHYSEIAKNKEDNNIKDLRLKIDKLKDEQKNIKDELLSQDIFNIVIKDLEIYYEISNNVFINYSIKNKNYQLLMNFININNYNKAIIEDIDKIINEQNIENKVKSIKDIYNKMEKFDEFIIKYKIEGENKIRIFGDKFVKNNKSNFKIIINDKTNVLIKEIRKKELIINKDNTFEIKLKLVNDINDISHIFDGCSSLLFPDIVNLDTSDVTDMSYMFNRCKLLTSIPDISNWNTNNVKKMNNLFSNCESLTSLPDISKWNTNNVTNMSYLFQNCYALSELPNISKWKTNNVTNMSFIFYKCIGLTSLPDLSQWNTENVEDISGIFQNCTKLISLFDISKWETKNVKNMKALFENCKALSSLPDISKWNTNNVIDMSFMFSQCFSISSLPDISKWDISKVNNMEYMFSFCSSLTNLPDLSKWNIKKDINKKGMFDNCSKLSSLPAL